MNIGMFTECYDPQINGVITSIKNLDYELTKLKHNVFKFAPRVGNYFDTESNIYRQPAIEYIFQKEFTVASILANKALKQVKKWNIELIHLHAELPMCIMGKKVARLLGIPFVFTFHTLWEKYTHYFFWDILPLTYVRLILKILYHDTRYFIAPTEKIKKYLENTIGVNAHIRIIPTGLRLELFYDFTATEESKIAFRNKFGIKKDDIVLLFVARIGKEKSVDVILKQLPRIAKKYPNIKLMLVGDGPGKKYLQRIVKRMRIENMVVFTGYIQWEKIPIAYKSADIFVNASLSETQGLVTIEALASELPVIVKKDQAHLSIINNGEYGLIFEKDDQLPTLVDKLLTNKDLRQRLISRSKSASQKYRVEEFGKRVEDYYNWIIDDYYTNVKKKSII